MTRPAGETPRLSLDDALRSCLQGSPSGRDALCLHLQPLLYQEGRRMLAGSRHEADDAVQTALIATLGYLDRSHGFSGDIKAFAATVVRNHCRSLLRADLRRRLREMRRAGEDAPPMMDSLDALVCEETRANLRRAMARLDPFCRDLLKLLYYFEKSPKEAAEHFGFRSVQNIYHHRDRCLQALKKIVKLERLRRSSSDDPDR